MASASWTVTRKDHEVRIDVTEAASLGQEDMEAIVNALEGYLAEDGVTTVRFDGPVLVEARQIPEPMALLITRLATLVEGRGSRFHVGPL